MIRSWLITRFGEFGDYFPCVDVCRSIVKKMVSVGSFKKGSFGSKSIAAEARWIRVASGSSKASAPTTAVSSFDIAGNSGWIAGKAAANSGSLFCGGSRDKLNMLQP